MYDFNNGDISTTIGDGVLRIPHSRSSALLLFWCLDHLLEETIDQLFAVTEVAAFGEVIGLLAPSATSVVQLCLKGGEWRI